MSRRYRRRIHRRRRCRQRHHRCVVDDLTEFHRRRCFSDVRRGRSLQTGSSRRRRRGIRRSRKRSWLRVSGGRGGRQALNVEGRISSLDIETVTVFHLPLLLLLLLLFLFLPLLQAQLFQFLSAAVLLSLLSIFQSLRRLQFVFQFFSNGESHILLL